MIRLHEAGGQSPEMKTKAEERMKKITSYLVQVDQATKKYKQAIDQGTRDWGYVGSLGHIEEELGNLVEFIGGKK